MNLVQLISKNSYILLQDWKLLLSTRSKNLDLHLFLFFTYLVTAIFQWTINVFWVQIGNILVSITLVTALIWRTESFTIYVPVQFLIFLSMYPFDLSLLLALVMGSYGLIASLLFGVIWRIDPSFNRFRDWVKFFLQSFLILLGFQLLQFMILNLHHELFTHMLLSSLLNIAWVVMVSPLLISYLIDTEISVATFARYVLDAISPYSSQVYLLLLAFVGIPTLQILSFKFFLHPVELFWLTLTFPIYIAYRFEKNFVSIYTVYDSMVIIIMSIIFHPSFEEILIYILNLAISLIVVSILASNERKLRKDQYEMQAMVLKIKSSNNLAELAGGIAHDFNNTLQALLGSAELLKLEYNEDLVDAIIGRVEVGMELTKELLSLSRRNPGRVTTFSIDEVVRSFAVIQNRIMRRKWVLKLDLNSRRNITMNRYQLINILQNLVTNSRDAMKDGGEIWIRTHESYQDAHDLLNTYLPSGRYILLEIQDTGIGIPKKSLSDIFIPYFTTKKERGSGLGLPSVRGLIEANNGYIDVESTLGEGTKVTLYIPPSYEEIEVDRQELSEWPMIEGQICVIDDDEQIRETLTMYLSSKGYSVVTFASGVEFLDSPNLESSGLVITDIIMEGKGGIEIVKEIRASDLQTPCILISGYQNVTKKELPQEVNIRYLQKPFSFADLQKEINRLMSNISKN